MFKYGRTTVGLMSALMLTTGLLTGCGPAGCSSSTSSTQSVGSQTASAEKAIDGLVVYYDGATLMFDDSTTGRSEGQTAYTVELGSASVDTNALHVGDMITVQYNGDIASDSTDNYQIVSVALKEGEENNHEVVGTLEDITANSISIRTIDGNKLTFNANNAQQNFYYGLKKGNWVTVVYNGDLQNNNTQGLAVVRIHDLDTEHVQEVKDSTTVTDASGKRYAVEDATVMSSYMMAAEELGTLKTSDSVEITGHCNNGWDRVNYNGKEAYIYSSELTEAANETSGRTTAPTNVQVVNIKELNETVYTKTAANVRENYSTSSKMIGTVKAGTAFTRTGICSNGWSRVIFNGKTAYIYSDLLTTTNPNKTTDGVTITAVNEEVFIASDASVRASWSMSADILGELKKGTKVTRTGVCSNGWSRINYNGKDAYVYSDLITKVDPNATDQVKIYQVNSYAWAATDCNIRESYSVGSKILGELKKGQGIKVTGVTNNNWTRVEYNGKVAYIHSDLLTSTNPNPQSTAPGTTTNVTNNNITNNNTTNNNTTNNNTTNNNTTNNNTTNNNTTNNNTTNNNTTNNNTTNNNTTNNEGGNNGGNGSGTTPTPSGEGSGTTPTPQGEGSGTTPTPSSEGSGESQGESQGEDQGESQGEDQGESQGESQGENQGESQGENQGENSEQQDEGEESKDGSVDTADAEANTSTIEGTIVSYSGESITIRVGGAASAANSTEESSNNASAANSEFQSTTYSEASGTESTTYTFNVSKAVQDFTKGADAGLTVKIFYRGDLSDPSSVEVTKVTDRNVKQQSSEGSVYSGIVSAVSGNTVTITSNGVNTVFNISKVANVDTEQLKVGATVRITANISSINATDNILPATKIEILQPASTESSNSEAQGDGESTSEQQSSESTSEQQTSEE